MDSGCNTAVNRTPRDNSRGHGFQSVLGFFSSLFITVSLYLSVVSPQPRGGATQLIFLKNVPLAVQLEAKLTYYARIWKKLAHGQVDEGRGQDDHGVLPLSQSRSEDGQPERKQEREEPENLPTFCRSPAWKNQQCPDQHLSPSSRQWLKHFSH